MVVIKSIRKYIFSPNFQLLIMTSAKAKEEVSPSSTFRHSVELGDSSRPLPNHPLTTDESSENRSDDSNHPTNSSNPVVRKLGPLIQDLLVSNSSASSSSCGKNNREGPQAHKVNYLFSQS